VSVVHLKIKITVGTSTKKSHMPILIGDTAQMGCCKQSIGMLRVNLVDTIIVKFVRTPPTTFGQVVRPHVERGGVQPYDDGR
jgi:hypothetical protein